MNMKHELLKLEAVKFGDRPSGSVTTYLRKSTQGYLRDGSANVPCNGCTACCRDPNLFVDVTDEEAKRLKVHQDTNMDQREYKNGVAWVLDRNEKGECVYLIDNRCSIYSERPKSCRQYDCRVHLLGFPVDPTQTVVNQEGVLQWSQFSQPTTEDKVAGLAIRLSILHMLKENPNPCHSDFGSAIARWVAYRDIAYEMYHDLHWMSEEELKAFFERRWSDE
jgi:hypothetical protein